MDANTGISNRTISPGDRKSMWVQKRPELLEKIESHRTVIGDQKERRKIVASLHAIVTLPKPSDQVGAILGTLSKAGVFRLRAVLVGTIAYQTYAAMLGIRLPTGAVHSIDIDIAQFQNISIAVEDAIPPMLDVLRQTEPSFRAIPHSHDARQTTRYQDKSGLRVDFLTPNTGADSDDPQRLDALNTDAERLRFLDFLIFEPVRAVVLHGGGVPVLVPSPQRYAVHKLIVARRRNEANVEKVEKDLWQASSLFDVLTDRRPQDLKDAWQEAWDRGSRWQKYLVQGLSQIPHGTRENLLKTIDERRNIIPGLQLNFPGGRPHYDHDRDIISFPAKENDVRFSCSISCEALEDDFGSDDGVKRNLMETFRKSRAVIEKLAASKFLYGPIESPSELVVKSGDRRNPLYAGKMKG